MQVSTSRREIWREIGLYNLKTACTGLRTAIFWLGECGVDAYSIAKITPACDSAVNIGKRLTAAPKINKRPSRARKIKSATRK